MLSVLVGVAWFVGAIVALIVVLIVGAIAWLEVVGRPRREPEPGFEYVRVEDGGAVFELNPKQLAWLEEYFSHPDAPWGGGRPSFKSHYASGQHGVIGGGFIERRQVPRGISIAPATEFDTLEQQLIDAGIPLDGQRPAI